ncbi:MAG: glycosyltransferase [Nanoarchaeota archaeon]
MKTKMKQIKISFLMAAHNEDKIIAKTLENFLKLPYDNFEVIIGLDGCTDNTEKIVKDYCEKSKKITYYKLNLRQGKNAVINFIIKKATGEVCIINDADWIFTVKDSKILQEFISVFNNKNIGGIAESFPVEWEPEKIKRGNIGYKMVAYSSYYWLKFQKEKYGTIKNNLRFLKKPTMFLTNVFRRKLYKENLSLGDDFERTGHIMEEGYDVVLFDNLDFPRMIAVYDGVKVKDLFKLKIRTAIAREQLKKGQRVKERAYYFNSVFFMIKESFKSGVSVGMIVVVWTLLTSIATLFSRFRKEDTKSGWRLRATRK